MSHKPSITAASPSVAAHAQARALADAKPPPKIIQGIFWMVLCTLSFVTVTGIVRHLGSNMPAAEAAFIRYALGILIMAPAFWRLWKSPPTKKIWKLGAVRGFAHTFGVTLWFFAMARIPIAEVTAIGYVTPIFVTIGAALFLGERLRLRRIMGVLAGLLGAMIILRPGFNEVSIGQLAQLATAPLFATSYLMTKSMTDKTDSQTIVALLTLFCTIFLFPLALLDWQTPTLHEIFWLFMCAIAATFGHFSMTRALAAAPISVTQPITFLQLVWAAALGIIVFGEAVDPFVILGGTIIVGAATFISHRENKMNRTTRTPPKNAAKF
ncbi:MAG: DMT family transporter [Pseudomonadota bacterium]